jgi:hypothetical protein
VTDAEVEHRGVAGLEVEATAFDLGEIRAELCDQLALGAEQAVRVVEQSAIREVGEGHVSAVTR